MTGVYQCTGRKANKPFYLNRICMRIYSAEELAFCICQNPELLERDIFSLELANWLEEECSAIDLSGRIYKLITSGSDLSKFVTVILDSFEFVSLKEKDRIVQVVKASASANVIEKRILRGDFFLEKERFGHAIREYTGVLDEIPEGNDALFAKVYHNIGVAQARLFLFEQAEVNFKKAYSYEKDKKHYLAYAACMRFRMSDSEYIKAASDDVIMSEVTLELEEQMQTAVLNWKESREAKEALEKKTEGQVGDASVYDQWIRNRMIDLKEDYHRYVV